MFRSKVSSILQTIVNRSSYNIGHTNLLPCRFLSTDVSHGNSTDTSNETSNITNNECLANASPQSEYSNKTLKESDDTVKALSESLNEGGTALGDSSIPMKAEVDQLFKKVEVEVRGNDHAVLESYGQFAVMAAEHLDITVGRNIALRKPIHERLTVLKSVHVHKKHRVQYESRTYYRYLDFFHLTGSTADTFLEYIQRNLPEGVAMKVTKVELQNLPDTVQRSSPVSQ